MLLQYRVCMFIFLVVNLQTYITYIDVLVQQMYRFIYYCESRFRSDALQMHLLISLQQRSPRNYVNNVRSVHPLWIVYCAITI